MNLVLYENWEAVNQEVGRKIGEGIGEVLTGTFQLLFNRVPLKDLFIVEDI